MRITLFPRGGAKMMTLSIHVFDARHLKNLSKPLFLMVWSVSSLIASARDARTAVSDRINLYRDVPHVDNAICQARQYGPGPIASANNEQSMTKCLPLKVENGNLVDSRGRNVTLKGINVDGAMKLPVKPFMPSYFGDTSAPDNVFFDGDNVSFVGRPFPLDEAESHFRRIKSWGFNTIRYLVTWEAIEHLGPGIYDEEFIDYTIKILQILHSVGGIYVFFESHQDVWSRFCGGSGAPMWTLCAAGMQPTRISSSGAAVLHSDAQFDKTLRSSPECYPKMLWTSNYKRLALFTMFTLFFAGEAYFPNLLINGRNIQHYLQLHHIKALEHFWRAVATRLPDMINDGTIVGFELLNEPNQGLVGHLHLNKIPDSQHLRIGTTPTVFDCFKLGMGFPVEVDVYKIAISGPQKCGRQTIDPEGASIWLSKDELEAYDTHYGWVRSGWTPGECIYAKAGIWSWDFDPVNFLHPLSLENRLRYVESKCELLLPHFFNGDQSKFNNIAPEIQSYISDVVDTKFFVNVCFLDYYVAFKKMIRAVSPNIFVLIQPLVLVIPPMLKDDSRNIIDDKTIYCPHYYDGMSLMFKTWNFRFNVDTLGIMRDKYSNPVFGIVLGETAIRNCIKKQFCEIVDECREYLGDIPVLMSETGMPFDMNGKRSYRTGKYRSQTSAIDALANALEGANMHHTYWCYTSINSHKWGDHWNNEDFSFWSPDDQDVSDAFCDGSESRKSDEMYRQRTSSIFSIDSYRTTTSTMSARQLIRNRLMQHKKRFLSSVFCPIKQEEKEDTEDAEGSESDNSTLCSENGPESESMLSKSNAHYLKQHYKRFYLSSDGVRAVSAVIRPFLMTTAGTRKYSDFNIKEATFELTLSFNSKQLERAKEMPTVIFSPKWHFPKLTYTDVDLTGGYVEYDAENEQLHWYMDEFACKGGSSDHTIIIRRFKVKKVQDGFNMCGY